VLDRGAFILQHRGHLDRKRARGFAMRGRVRKRDQALLLVRRIELLGDNVEGRRCLSHPASLRWINVNPKDDARLPSAIDNAGHDRGLQL
jgi:hypothetical protein